MDINLPESILAIALAHYGDTPLAVELSQSLLHPKDPTLFCDILEGSLETLKTCQNSLTHYYDDNQQFRKAKKDALNMVEVLQKEIGIEIEKRTKNASEA